MCDRELVEEHVTILYGDVGDFDRTVQEDLGAYVQGSLGVEVFSIPWLAMAAVLASRVFSFVPMLAHMPTEVVFHCTLQVFALLCIPIVSVAITVLWTRSLACCLPRNGTERVAVRELLCCAA